METLERISEERAEKIRPYSYTELEQIADRISARVAKELEEYYVRARVFFSRIHVEVGTPFYEISDAVAAQIENAYNMSEEFAQEVDMLAEAEIQELFEERYEDMLAEINAQYAVYVSGKVETQKYTVSFEPLECGSDYCVAGLLAEVELKDRVEDTDIENIAQLIATVFRL